MRKLSLFFLLVLMASAGSAASFGSSSGTLPNVISVEIYEVTGLTSSQKETGGTLVDSGLNSTLEINLSQLFGSDGFFSGSFPRP